MFGTETRNKGVTLLAAKTGHTKGHISQVLSGKRRAKPELARLLKRNGYAVNGGYVVARSA